MHSESTAATASPEIRKEDLRREDLKRELGLGSATAVVAGECIAVGIFLTPAGMAKALGSPMWLLLVWLVVEHGWRAVFFTTGIGGMVWGLVWLLAYRAPRESRRVNAAELELIETGGWVPHLLCDTSGTYWDGCTAIDKHGQAVNGLSDSGRKEMITMILDGRFGEEVKDAYLDQTRYWQIRDELITWPNQEAIQSKGLRVQQVALKS